MRALWRSIDIRAGEGPMAAGAFAVLLLVITAHSMLETARDALFLAKLPVKELTGVYVIVAALALLIGPASGALSRRLGAHRALTVSLFVAAALTGGLFFMRGHASAVIALYVVSGLLGAILVPQFWAVVDGMFTMAQARRLFGVVATAGVLGGVVGSGAAALLVGVLPVATLLLVASAILGLTATLTLLAPAGEKPPEDKQPARVSVFREEPFLLRIGLLVILSTSSLLVLDYLFKLRVALSIPPAELGAFFARFYTGLNALSIVVQLFLGGAIIRRLGVAAAVGFTPALLLLASLGTLFSGGALIAVFAAKLADGGLRYSVHRVSSELLYLPVPTSARERAKPLLDGAFARGAQALTALALLGLGAVGLGSGRLVTVLLAVLTVSWFVVAVTVRRPYLALFRRALAAGAITPDGGEGLDLSSAEVLIERLSNLDSSQVVAAMDVLERRGRARLIPALVLYRTEELVLRRALEIFAGSDRNDWTPLGQRLLDHESEGVRHAAMRALATHGAGEVVEKVAEDGSPRMRAYAAVCLAARDGQEDLLVDVRVHRVLAGCPPSAKGDDENAVRAGILAAVADLGGPASAHALLRRLSEDARVQGSAELITLLADAIGKSGDTQLIDWLVARLERGDGRLAVRAALAQLGEPAYEAVASALLDERLPRRLRSHLPRTLAAFGTQRAADLLLARLADDRDGLVRYKSLRALGRVIADRQKLRLDRRTIEHLAFRNLVEHLRLLSLHAHVDDIEGEPTSRLLRGLLDDKLQQSLERVFRLLKLAHRQEDLHRVHEAALGDDKRQRGNAAEFLDALLSRPDQRDLRLALRIVLDDLPAHERVSRAAFALPKAPPANHAEAIAELIGDADLMIATLATEYALRHHDRALIEAAGRARSGRPALAESGRRFFASPSVEAALAPKSLVEVPRG